jgi:AGZA family xanthine/uracil permease-like MFS transporter
MGALDHRAVFLLIGILIAAVLMRRNNPLAFLAAIFSVTALAWTLGYAKPPDGLVSAPDFSSAFLALDIRGALKMALLPAIVAILFTDLFDSLSTFIGVASAAGLTDADGRTHQPAPRADRRRGGDAGVRPRGDIAGNGVRREHRRDPHGRPIRPRVGGDGAVFPALLFSRAAGVGRSPTTRRRRCSCWSASRCSSRSRRLISRRSKTRFPPSSRSVLIPLTLSITQGILWGFLLHALLYTVAGRWRDVGLTLWCLSLLSAGLLLLGH